MICNQQDYNLNSTPASRPPRRSARDVCDRIGCRFYIFWFHIKEIVLNDMTRNNVHEFWYQYLIPFCSVMEDIAEEAQRVWVTKTEEDKKYELYHHSKILSITERLQVFKKKYHLKHSDEEYYTRENLDFLVECRNQIFLDKGSIYLFEKYPNVQWTFVISQFNTFVVEQEMKMLLTKGLHITPKTSGAPLQTTSSDNLRNLLRQIQDS